MSILKKMVFGVIAGVVCWVFNINTVFALFSNENISWNIRETGKDELRYSGVYVEDGKWKILDCKSISCFPIYIVKRVNDNEWRIYSPGGLMFNSFSIEAIGLKYSVKRADDNCWEIHKCRFGILKYLVKRIYDDYWEIVDPVDPSQVKYSVEAVESAHT